MLDTADLRALIVSLLISCFMPSTSIIYFSLRRP